MCEFCSGSTKFRTAAASQLRQGPVDSYDAILIVSFGGPEGPDDVIPFLENVLRGRNVPRQRLLEVAEHYGHFGGVSPINAQNRALVSTLQNELKQHGPKLPVYLGNRNWHPFLADILRQMRDGGVRRALGFFTSAYSSYSGCRQYLENIAAAQREVGDKAPEVHKLRAYFNHPGFIEPMIEHVREALTEIPADNNRSQFPHLVFTAHSIPTAMANNCRYESQLLDACQSVASGAGCSKWRLVYQSRSGSPSQPWLEPDVNDYLRELATKNVRDVVVVPIGFISDHIEVLYDLDFEAKNTAQELGINMVRAGTVGVHPRFVQMIRELVVERITASPERTVVGKLGPSHVCQADCCPSGRPV
jgi:protoporphyrin/coproporphyrin ferrochelatase